MTTFKPTSLITKSNPLHLGRIYKEMITYFKQDQSIAKHTSFARPLHYQPPWLRVAMTSPMTINGRPRIGEEPGAGNLGPRWECQQNRIPEWVSRGSGSAGLHQWGVGGWGEAPFLRLYCCDWEEDGAGRIES